MKNLAVNKKGATLIEVLGSTMVFLIAIAALLGVYIQAINMAKRAGYTYTAYNLAKNKIEQIKTKAFSALILENETNTLVNAEGDADASGEYQRTTVVTTPYGGYSTLAKVKVSLSYTFRGTQSPSTMEMTTLIYDE